MFKVSEITLSWKRLGLISLLGLVICVYFYLNNPDQNQGYFLRCPTNFLFGINCPGCGVQRAIHHLLHLNFLQALRANALFVCSLPLFISLLFDFIFETKKTTQLLSNKFVIVGLLLVVLLFGILRNVAVFPFILLNP